VAGVYGGKHTNSRDPTGEALSYRFDLDKILWAIDHLYGRRRRQRPGWMRPRWPIPPRSPTPARSCSITATLSASSAPRRNLQNGAGHWGPVSASEELTMPTLECPGVFIAPGVPEGWTASGQSGEFCELQPSAQDVAIHISVDGRERQPLRDHKARDMLAQFMNRALGAARGQIRDFGDGPGEQRASPGHRALAEAERMLASIAPAAT
jgi:hypothetical protein